MEERFDMKKNILVIGGLGVVGGALVNYLKSYDYDVEIYDIKMQNNLKLKHYLKDAEHIFICVPTPSLPDGHIDTSIIESVTKEISKECGLLGVDPKVIFKSTIVPGTTEKLKNILKENCPNVKVAYNPEFLRQKFSIQETFAPNRIVVGSDDIYFAREIMDIYKNTEAPKFVFDSFEAAELVKYYANCYYAARISFFNQMKKFADKFECNHNDIVQAIIADKMVGIHGSNPTGKAYGGNCLPKEISAIIEHGKDLGIDVKMLKAVKGINDDLVREEANIGNTIKRWL